MNTMKLLGTILFSCFLAANGFAANTVPWVLAGNAASSAEAGREVLTGHVQSQVGAMWNPCSINLASGFDMLFTVNFGGDQCGGSGLAFVLQTQGTGVFGASADEHGYDNGSINANSLAIVFDTTSNPGAPYSDPSYDSIGIETGDSVTDQGVCSGGTMASTATLCRPPISPTQPNIKDNQDHSVEIKFNPADASLSVLVDGSARVTYNLPFSYPSTLFGGTSNVTYGWTASTGNSSNVQQVQQNSADPASCVSTPTPGAPITPTPAATIACGTPLPTFTMGPATNTFTQVPSTGTATRSPTSSPIFSPTRSPTSPPSATPSQVLTPTRSPSLSPTPSPSPTLSASPSPWQTPTPYASVVWDDMELGQALSSGDENGDTANGASVTAQVITAAAAHSGSLGRQSIINTGNSSAWGVALTSHSPYGTGPTLGYRDLSGAKALQFWIRVSAPVTLSLQINEAGSPGAPVNGADGERWDLGIPAPTPGVWQQVQIPLAWISRSLYTPVSGNGTLDLGGIAAITLNFDDNNGSSIEVDWDDIVFVGPSGIASTPTPTAAQLPCAAYSVLGSGSFNDVGFGGDARYAMLGYIMAHLCGRQRGLLRQHRAKPGRPRARFNGNPAAGGRNRHWRLQRATAAWLRSTPKLALG